MTPVHDPRQFIVWEFVGGPHSKTRHCLRCSQGVQNRFFDRFHYAKEDNVELSVWQHLKRIRRLRPSGTPSTPRSSRAP